MRKPYIDWDLKLSALEDSGFFDGIEPADICKESFADCSSSSTEEWPKEYPWKVQVIRRIALRTPMVVCEMLRRMKCFVAPDGEDDDEDDGVYVLVKEGTRRIGGSDKCDTEASDWKISFHFVFQVNVSHFQFKCLYEMMTSFISNSTSRLGTTSDTEFSKYGSDVAMVLELVSDRDYEHAAEGRDDCPVPAKRPRKTEEKERRWRAGLDPKSMALCKAVRGALDSVLTNPKLNLSPLVGMDLHPLRTEFQGLACLGSKKEGAERGNRLLGMMKVDILNSDGGSQWIRGYCKDTHPLLVLAEASTIMPGPRCIGLAPMNDWQPVVSTARRKAVEEAGVLHHQVSEKQTRVEEGKQNHQQTLYSSIIECKLRIQESVDALMKDTPALRAVACTYMGVDSSWKVKRSRCVVKLDKRGEGSVPAHHIVCPPRNICNKQQVLDSVPQWFRGCLNSVFGDGQWHMGFQSCSTNVSYAQVPDILQKVSSECRLIHVSTNVMRICTLELLRVPFKVCLCLNMRVCVCSGYEMRKTTHTHTHTHTYPHIHICRSTRSTAATGLCIASTKTGSSSRAWTRSAARSFVTADAVSR